MNVSSRNWYTAVCNCAGAALALVLLASLLPAQVPPGRVSRIVANVGNDAITSIELDRVLAPYQQQPSVLLHTNCLWRLKSIAH